MTLGQSHALSHQRKMGMTPALLWEEQCHGEFEEMRL